jgi:TPR repeat protein
MTALYDAGAAAYDRGDYVTARQLWLPLAEAGDADAQTMLGIIYEEGLAIPHDYAAAMTWYRRAADQGGRGAAARLKKSFTFQG